MSYTVVPWAALPHKMLSDNLVRINNVILDGAITPYQLPKIITRLIAVRVLMIAFGKIGVKTSRKAFATDEYGPEELQYIAEVLNFHEL